MHGGEYYEQAFDLVIGEGGGKLFTPPNSKVRNNLGFEAKLTGRAGNY